MKTIVVTFAGRKRYLEILFPYILKYRRYINEYHLYLATTNTEDRTYIEDFARNHIDFVRLIKAENYNDFNRSRFWASSYKNCSPDAIYLRLDDDIVYLDELLFTDFLDFRKQSNAPVVYPHIINNTISTPLMAKMGKLDMSDWSQETMVVNTWKKTMEEIKKPIYELKNSMPTSFGIASLIPRDKILCPVAWERPEYGKRAHNEFLGKTSKEFCTENIILENYEPMPIQCCSWKGSDMIDYTNKFGAVIDEEEPWLSVYLPYWANNPNIIFGKSIVSHFSFWRQETEFLRTDLLERYNTLCRKLC